MLRLCSNVGNPLSQMVSPSPPHPTPPLAGRDLRSGDCVAVEVVVDVGSVSRVGGLDVAGDLGGRGHRLGASTSNLDLSARDVKLRWTPGVVDAQLLNTEQIVTSRDAAGDGGGVSRYEEN